MMKISHFILVIVVLACTLTTRLWIGFIDLWQPSQAVVRGYLHRPSSLWAHPQRGCCGWEAFYTFWFCRFVLEMFFCCLQLAYCVGADCRRRNSFKLLIVSQRSRIDFWESQDCLADYVSTSMLQNFSPSIPETLSIIFYSTCLIKLSFLVSKPKETKSSFCQLEGFEPIDHPKGSKKLC